MWEWVSSRPPRCLKVGTDSVALAGAERNWRGRRRHRCVSSSLPDGAVKPSPAEQNLSDVSTLEDHIRAVASIRSGGQVAGRALVSDLPQRIVLLLPDAAVRAVVLHLDQLPGDREERDALIRWRLGQEQLFPLSGAKVVSQVFQGPPRSAERTHTVLAAAIQESVLRQYEAACESVGLIPQEVGMTSLRLFDLWRRAAGGSGWRRRNFLWANVSDGALTTMVFQQGQVLFYRCKLLGSDPASAGEKADTSDKIIEECGASLDLCRQRHPSAAIEEAVVCADGDLLSTLPAQLEAGLDLFVEQLGWRSVEGLGWVAKESQRGMTSLAAIAGVP